MGYGRKIGMAYDKLSEKTLLVEDVFSTYQEAYQVRREYHEEKYDFSCCECGQKLEVSTSKKSLVHFKHAKGTDSCILKESKFSEDEMKLIKEFHVVRESDRHIELKNKIGNQISKEEGVKGVHIDNKVVFDEGNRRRPDVLCTYKDNTLVFEIQLSKLPLKYMLGRVNFYNSKGYFLIWILDNINLDSQDQMVKDIKYLHPSQNFFSLDDHSKSFKMICSYKWAYANERNEIRYQWRKKSVSLHQLTFKKGKYEAYFFDFDYRVDEVRQEIKKNQDIKIKHELERAEEKKRAQEIQIEHELKLAKKRKKEEVKSIIDDIKFQKQNKGYDYKSIEKDILRLDYSQKKLLNKKLNIKNRVEKPAIHAWIETADNDDLSFLKFILLCNAIEYDVNQNDHQGRSVLYYLLNNEKIMYKEFLFRYLAYRGFLIDSKDEELLINFYENKTTSDSMILFFNVIKKIKDPLLRLELYEERKLLCILESIKRNEIIGFNYKKGSWVQFANNAISHHAEDWRIFQMAFKHYGLWDTLMSLDKKGTFLNKLQKFNGMCSYKEGFKNRFLLIRLYPEINKQISNYFNDSFY